MAPSYQQQANDYNLWQEYFDTGGQMSEDEFNAFTEAEKVDMLRQCYGPEVAQE